MTAARATLGILAGGGSLPREIADLAAARGRDVLIVALDGEADTAFGPHRQVRVRWGQVGALLRAFRNAGCREIVIVGSVRRPDLTRIRIDFGFLAALPAIWRIVRSGGDDGVLRGVVRFFEGQGLRVVSPAEAAPEIVVGEELIAGPPLAPDARSDAARGFEIVRRLGAFDIGQGAIVTSGKLEALEGAEGTDRMLARVALRRRTTGGKGGVLVKRPKPGQELRVDLPVVGPRTVAGAAQAGLAGIAVLAGRVLVAERARTAADAVAAHLSVAGCADAAAERDVARRAARTAAALRLHGRQGAQQSAVADARLGVEILDALASEAAGAAVVVDGYVLAVETGEGLGEMIGRAATIRPWGGGWWHRRRGVVVLAPHVTVTLETVQAAIRGGFAGLARGSGPGEGFTCPVRQAADAGGLFLATFDLAGEGRGP